MAKKLLIADDAMIIREMIRDAVTEAGWEVVGTAENGEEAIELYKQFQPDAVTMDLVMPGFDGIHGLRGILAFNPQAKVVIVSALEQKALLKETFKLGAADFMVKPFNKRALVETLDQTVAV